MSSTENKMLKICKLKFTNRFELHEKVSNIPVFVDKFLHGIKFGPFSVAGLQHFSGQVLLLSIFITGVGACKAFITDETLGEILAYYVLAFIMLYAHFSISAAVDLKGKEEVLKTNLVDYLENNISARIPESKKEQERLDKLEAAAERKDADIRDEVKVPEGLSEKAERKPAEIADFAAHKKQGEEKKLAPEEEEELGGLLMELWKFY